MLPHHRAVPRSKHGTAPTGHHGIATRNRPQRHTLEVAEALCDRIAIIQGGEIRAQGTMDDLRREARAGDAGLEEIFLKLTGGHEVQELLEVLDA